MMPSWYLEKPLGEYVSIYEVITGEKIKGMESGAITSFLCYLIEEKMIDGVVAAKKIRGLEGEIVIARTSEEVINTAGSKWQVLPFTLKLKETIERENLNKIAIVGLPCQINFLRQMKTFPLLETDFSGRINFLIGLFCFGTFAQESILSYIKEKYGIEPSTIKEVKISHRALKFSGKKDVELPFDEIMSYIQVGCLLCPDYTGVASDVSAGTIGEKTILIVRNKKIDELLQKAENNGYVEIENANRETIETIEKRAIEKINRASKYIAQLL